MSESTNHSPNSGAGAGAGAGADGKKKKFGRRSRSRETKSSSRSNTASDYVPPSFGDNDFVTSPPKQRDGGGLTTGISTLFRRAGSKDAPSSSRKKKKKKEAVDGSTNAAAGILEATLASIDKTASNVSRNPSRIFSNDDSDDSYESRISAAYSRDEDDDDDDDASTAIQRFRGFSTSLQSLFLDESLVCASIGCFGLLLSQRTEFLLDVRNRQRGASRRAGNKGAHRYPSRVLAYALVVTILLMTGTFVIFGFGSANGASSSSNNNNNNNNNNNGGNNNGDYDGEVYYQSNDDDGRFVDDNVQNDDEAAAAENDDAAAAANDDDAASNDDAVAANDDDDDAAVAANYDDYYANNDDGGRTRRRETVVHVPGYFKIENYHEHVWKPLQHLIHDEWQERIDLAVPRKLANSNGDEIDLGATIRLILAMLFMLILGVVGRRRRMRTRYALVRSRAQEDHLFYASSTKAKLDTAATEDNYEGACSHTLCGCYPSDPTIDEEIEAADDLKTNGSKRKHQDCVSRAFQCLLASFCGAICKCWCQCLSICALAQEAREIRLLVPPKFQRIDYLTHQPFSEYQVSVNDLRRGWLGKTRRKAGIWPHIQALSRLSRYILIMFLSVFFIISATLIFNPRASFSWPDLIVLIATFVQAFLVLYVIHWIFHKSDLSLDAVVKFFAAGFVVAVPSAFFLEGMLINVILAATYSLYALVEWIVGDIFIEWVVSHYRFLWIIGELINAYVIAAIMEELCKYYTFRAVEHPDLVFLTGLNRKQQSNDAFGGGVVHYPYGSHQVSKLNRSNSFESVSSRSSRRSTRSEKSATQQWIDQTNTDDEFFEDDNDVRTHRQKAAALTTGMISVAVGLACAENFLYVFLLGGSGDGDAGVKEEWVVLFFRSIFPVHALSAALQSINMIRKFVECPSDTNSGRIGVGKIILPAVLLHGSFDAVLLGINVYVESAWDYYLEANDGVVEEGVIPYNTVAVNVMAWLSITCIMIIGILWYYREHRNQKMRLKVLEQEDEGNGYNSPGKPPTSEIEIV